MGRPGAGVGCFVVKKHFIVQTLQHGTEHLFSVSMYLDVDQHQSWGCDVVVAQPLVPRSFVVSLILTSTDTQTITCPGQPTHHPLLALCTLLVG